jgi:hypothetical protein
VPLVILALSLEAIPIGALISAAFDRSLRRRSGFWHRVTGVVMAMSLPALVALVAPVGERAAVTLLWAGLGWGLLLCALSWFVLFQGFGPGPSQGDDDDDGPGPEDGRPTPRSPLGGIPLPDATPSAIRLRDGHHPRPSSRPRRRVRERERRTPRVRPLRLWAQAPGPRRAM